MSQKMLLPATVVGLFMFLIYAPFPIGVIVYLFLGGVAGLVFCPTSYKKLREVSGIMFFLGLVGAIGWGLYSIS